MLYASNPISHPRGIAHGYLASYDGCKRFQVRDLKVEDHRPGRYSPEQFLFYFSRQRSITKYYSSVEYEKQKTLRVGKL